MGLKPWFKHLLIPSSILAGICLLAGAILAGVSGSADKTLQIKKQFSASILDKLERGDPELPSTLKYSIVDTKEGSTGLMLARNSTLCTPPSGNHWKRTPKLSEIAARLVTVPCTLFSGSARVRGLNFDTECNKGFSTETETVTFWYDTQSTNHVVVLHNDTFQEPVNHGNGEYTCSAGYRLGKTKYTVMCYNCSSARKIHLTLGLKDQLVSQTKSYLREDDVEYDGYQSIENLDFTASFQDSIWGTVFELDEYLRNNAPSSDPLLLAGVVLLVLGVLLLIPATIYGYTKCFRRTKKAQWQRLNDEDEDDAGIPLINPTQSSYIRTTSAQVPPLVPMAPPCPQQPAYGSQYVVQQSSATYPPS